MKNRLFQFGFCSVLAWVLLSVAVAGQPRVSLSGTARDQWGVAISDAKVKATNTKTDQEFKTVTGEKGEFTFPALTPGNYTIEIELTGFNKLVKKGVLVNHDAKQTTGFLTLAKLGTAPLLGAVKLSQDRVRRPVEHGYYSVDLTILFSDKEGDACGFIVTRIDPHGTRLPVIVEDAARYGFQGKGGAAVYPIIVRAGEITGNHRIEVVGRDRPGNESKAVTVTLAISDDGTPPLSIAGVSPLSGKPGIPITITGAGFFPQPEANVVMIGGKRATVVAATSTRLELRIPLGAASGPVTVTNHRGSVRSPSPLMVDPSIVIETFGRRSVTAGQRLQLAARITGLGTAPVSWSVNDIPGGSAVVGTIDAEGVYVAPAPPPPGGRITIGATAGSGTQSVSITVTINVADPCAGSGKIEVRPGARSALVDQLGLIRVVFSAGAVTSPTSVTATSHGVTDLKIPAGYRALRRFSLVSQQRTLDLSQPAELSVDLPGWRMPGTELPLYSRSPSGALTQITQFSADASGLRATGVIRALGELVLAEDVRVVPPWDKTQMKITGIRVPAKLDQDPGPGIAIQEGSTLPVLIEGSGFTGGQVEVEVAGGEVESAGVARVATPAELAAITVTGGMVGSKGNQLGFTLRSDAIPSLNPGEFLRLVFAVQRFAGGTTPAERFTTAPTAFAIRGLPELIVNPRPGEQQDLFAVDGTPIDTLLSESGRTYSKIHVKSGAVLGIGRALGTARLPIDAGGALMEVDLSSLAKFQEAYGGLPWAAGKPASSRIFVPFREHVEINVVGTVQIDGTVYLAGMGGGENHELRPIDPTLPEDERMNQQLQNARRSACGGLSVRLDDPFAYSSGGMGGDGGQTSGSGESIQVGDGYPAGNGIAVAGVGRRPVRVVGSVQTEPYPNVLPALGGKGAILGTEPVLGFLNGVLDVGVPIAVAIASGGTGLPTAGEVTKLGHLLGDAANTDYGPLETQLNLVKQARAAYAELRGAHDYVTSTGEKLFTPMRASYPSQNIEFLSGRGGHGGTKPEALAASLSRDEQILPGGGGGGGGGGGSSTVTTVWPTVIPFHEHFAFNDSHFGGAGGGGGGGAAAVRITAGEKLMVGYFGAIQGAGGRGGYGQRHVLLAGDGGGGGGGAGAILKLQAPVVVNENVIDASGGSSGGALLGMRGLPLPYTFAQVQTLAGPFKGGFITHLRNANHLHMVYPTGRLRCVFVAPAPIAGVGVAIDTATGKPDDGLLLVEPAPSMRIWRTQPLNYNEGLIPLTPQGAWAEDLGNALAQFPNLTIADIAQDPVAPHHIFVAGFERQSNSRGATRIIELDPRGQFVREAFNYPTYDNTYAGAGVEHVQSLDFGTDGRLFALMSVVGDEFLEPTSLYEIARPSGGLTRIRPALNGFCGMSVLRAGPGTDRDQFAMSWRDTTVYEENSPPVYNSVLHRWSLSGQDVSQVTMGIESVGIPGEAGLVRIDGLAECCRLPKLEENEVSVNGVDYQTFTHFEPTVGNLGTAKVFDAEQRVTRDQTLVLKVLGAGPQYRDNFMPANARQTFDIVVLPEGAAPRTNRDKAANHFGTLEYQVQLDLGFSAIWVQGRSSDTPPLLRRHVLRLD